jgi:ABC-type Fe3+ transport system permease subunit
MITKILLTISVIVAAIFFLRMRNAAEDNASGPGRLRHSKPAAPSEGEKMFRQGAWLFLIFMVISALVMVVFNLGDEYETVKVHVVNTQTGHRVTYQAERKDIKPSQFTTLDGRTVYIANVERLEVEQE